MAKAAKKKKTQQSEVGREVKEQDQVEVAPGFEVYQRIVYDRANRHGNERILHRGWILRYTDPDGRTQYAGSMLKWVANAKYVFDPINTKEEAVRMAEQQYNRWVQVEEARRKVWRTIKVTLDVPMAVLEGVAPRQPGQTNWKMSREDTEAMFCVLTALRQSNTEWTEGRPIINNTDVLRYLFSQLRAARDAAILEENESPPVA